MFVITATIAFSQSTIEINEMDEFVTVCVELFDAPLIFSLSAMVTSNDGKNNVFLFTVLFVFKLETYKQ